MIFKCLQIKGGGSNFLVEEVLQNVCSIWSPLLYFNLKSSMDTNSASLLHLNVFCMIQEYFSHGFEISTN